MNPGLFCLLAATAALPACGNAQNSSVYTDLAGTPCVTINSNAETGATVRRCPGMAGYELLVLDDDSRMSVSIVAPDKTQHALDLWSVVTRSFSAVGKKAEWRVSGTGDARKPIALIVRVDALNQSDLRRAKKISYLAVAKITGAQTCVVGRISPKPNANVEARQLADHAADRPCLAPLASLDAQHLGVRG